MSDVCWAMSLKTSGSLTPNAVGASDISGRRSITPWHQPMEDTPKKSPCMIEEEI